MKKYEYIEKPISKKRRIATSLMILFGTLLLAGYLTVLLYQATQEGLLVGNKNMYSLWSFPIIILSIGLFLSFYYWRRKKIKELTQETKAEIKKQKDELDSRWYVSRWYVRYFGAILALIIAYISYVSYTTAGFRMPVLGLLLFNPVTGIMATIIAIFNAWEISLIIVVAIILYYTYLGVAALPVSVAIIIGSIIIAYGVYKYKAQQITPPDR